MELRARYVLIGAFALAVIVAGFGFVFWLNNTGGLGERARYEVRFETSVSGLLLGSAVQFNGIRVGEVTDLRLNPEAPRQVIATIAIDSATPVHADTRVDLDFSGLTGVPEIALVGGDPTSPQPEASEGRLPVLVADKTAGADWTQAARDAFQQIDNLLTGNSDALKDTLANLDTFSQALGRNAGRVDTILSGLERFAGNVAKGPSTIYDLSAPHDFTGVTAPPAGQLVVNEPTAVVALDSQRILVQSEGGEITAFDDAQWSDSLPKLLQARLIRGFENAGYDRVGNDTQGLTADYQLLVDVRSFRIATAPDRVADVELMAKLTTPDGQIVASRSFQATKVVDGMDAAAAAAALNNAFGTVASELVRWVLEGM